MKVIEFERKDQDDGANCFCKSYGLSLLQLWGCGE